MNSLSEVATGLAQNPLAWFSTLLIAAVVYLWKQVRDGNDKHLATLQLEKTEQKELMMMVIPLAEKLGEAVESLERITLAQVGGKDK